MLASGTSTYENFQDCSRHKESGTHQRLMIHLGLSSDRKTVKIVENKQ